MFFDSVGPLLSNVVTKLPDLFRSAKSDSLIEYGKGTRNDFVTLIEDSLIDWPNTPYVTQTALSLVCGYYLSAVSLATPMAGINVMSTLDKLNTKRDPLGNAVQAGVSIFNAVGVESFKYGLPSHNNELDKVAIAMEANNSTFNDHATDKSLNRVYSRGSTDESTHHYDSHDINTTHNTTNNTGARYNISVGGGGSGRRDEKERRELGFGRDTVKDLKELSNMAVGKQIEVTFEANNERKAVMVNINLACTNTDADTMRRILALGSYEKEFSERLVRARSGELGYFKDLILCNDLIEEARKARIRDKSGLLQSILRKRSNNFISGLLSLNPSVNNASAVIILSEETAKSVELELGGSLDKFPVRERIFKNVSAMILIVVNRKWEEATFYHRSLDSFSSVRISELKRATQSGGQNIEDILNAYTKFSAPTIG